MSNGDRKKIFLSHKGADKDMVIDFKETLASLGYEPWLDDEAMPAGTGVERGILQGMKDSCGVAFFVTPLFKDENFLATEIDYAIQQKREKGNDFAIVTLRFIGADGKFGQIPELLTPYVWKEVKTPLAGLREILRALPVAPAAIVWRDEITGSIPVPGSSSKALSAEAKKLLMAAVSGDGSIKYRRLLAGPIILSGKRSMIPVNSDRRIINLWKSALRELNSNEYIYSDYIGEHHENYIVTKQGYDAADALSDG